MASPVFSRSEGGGHHGGAVASDRDRRRLHQEIAAKAAQRRRFNKTPIGPVSDAVSELVVLQKDFANQVGSPTGGYILAEIVIDATTNKISIYVPP